MMLTGLLRVVTIVVVLCGAGPQAVCQTQEVDFSRDVRPILSDVCFGCHGPDAAQRVSEMRLDTRDGVFAAGTDGAAVSSRQPRTERTVSTDHISGRRCPNAAP